MLCSLPWGTLGMWLRAEPLSQSPPRFPGQDAPRWRDVGYSPQWHRTAGQPHSWQHMGVLSFCQMLILIPRTLRPSNNRSHSGSHRKLVA